MEPSALLTEHTSSSSSEVDSIVQRLAMKGVPMQQLQFKQMGLVQFVKQNKPMLQEVVSALLPGVDEAQLPDSAESTGPLCAYEQGCREGVRWAQWLMFEGDPEEKLAEIQQHTGCVRGVCGAVWGNHDFVYRCRTCENDPTCAICVPCFEAGDHLNHDYSIIHTEGGCCDCGDITAWKESGFCSHHGGSGQVPSLSEALVHTLEPALDAVFLEWARRLRAVERIIKRKSNQQYDQASEEKVASLTTAAIVEMLLKFCNCSESMLTFIGGLIASEKAALLEILLRSECFLPKNVMGRLHELLFKLLGDPSFKFQFARAYVAHYPHVIHDALREEPKYIPGSQIDDNTTLSNFSVQIFTVPALTSRLVVEFRLLDMLLETLKDVFLSFAGEDGHLMVSKSVLSSNLCQHLVADIQFVMRHSEVAEYVARERPDLSVAWLYLLACTQGMDPQRRQTSTHVEEEAHSWVSALWLEMQMAGINPLHIDGAAKTDHVVWMKDKISLLSELEDEDTMGRHAKIGRISRESDVLGNTGTSGGSVDIGMDSRDIAAGMVDQGSSPASVCKNLVPAGKRNDALISNIPAALLWLIAECVKTLAIWLLLDASRETAKSKRPSVQKGDRMIQRRGMSWRGSGGRGVTTRDAYRRASDEPSGGALDVDVSTVPAGKIIDWFRCNIQIAALGQDMSGEQASTTGGGALTWNYLDPHGVNPFLLLLEGQLSRAQGSADQWMESERPDPSPSLAFIWSDREWSEMVFDVSQQEVSFHIPLHRFLALTVSKSLEICANIEQQEASDRTWHCANQSIGDQCFFIQLFPPGYRMPGFASLLIEHPLRLQVFCAQVRAGMWRRNGYSVQTLCDNYRSVKWCEVSSDLDLFLLQCCGAMAPPEDFVERIVSRFGLAEYFSLFLLRPNEYETSLAQQMLSFLIQLICERGFCGFSAEQSSRRELVRRLAISDATHSQLMKSLPPFLLENKQWQETLQSISTYCKPSGMRQGRYSLREDCWQELDLYHPRWSARELQSAEERYVRACKVSALINQIPKWQKPFAPLQSLSRIATCGKVHDMLRSVFFHAAFAEKISESRAPEGVLITALHLLALGLDVCASAYKQNTKYTCTVVQGASDIRFSTTSPTHDAQERPPLLEKASERVYIGGADGTEISSRQSLLSLLVILMQRHSIGEAHGAPAESNQCSIGDLIKCLLRKFAELHRECMYTIESIAPQILHRVSTDANDKGADSKVKEELPDLSEAETRKMLARERQAAIMAKMKAAQEKFLASVLPLHEGRNTDKGRSQSKDSDVQNGKGRAMNEHSDPCSTTLVCSLCRDSVSDSPMSFLTFVQRSKLLAISEKGIPSWEREDQRGKIESSDLGRGVDEGAVSGDTGVRASQVRMELLDLIQRALSGEMDRQGPLEVETLLDLLMDEGPVYLDTTGRQDSATNLDVRMSESSSSEAGSDELIEEENNDSCSGSLKSLPMDMVYNGKDVESMDLEEKEVTRERFMINVLLEYVSILSRNQKEEHNLHVENDNSGASSGLQRQRFLKSTARSYVGDLLLNNSGSDDNVGVHMSSCGHAVHQDCLDRYLSSLSCRYRSRTPFEGLQIVDPDQGEFLCPLCRRLANSFLPLFVGSSISSAEKGQGVSVPSSCIEAGASSASFYEPSRPLKILQVSQAIDLLKNAEEQVWKLGFRKAVSKPLPKALKAVFDCLFSKLCGLYFPEKENTSKLNNGNVSQSLLLWDVLRYTIMSAELAARTRVHAFSSKTENRLDALWKAGDSSKGSILPLLLRAAKAIQNQDRQTVLLRARGMQLLVGVFCYGVSKDSLSEPYMSGISSKILQIIDKGEGTADIQFWKRTADPVLAHDPFSTLVYLAFCLPLSFLSSTEPFVLLVHLLYLVCITQIVAFMGDFLVLNSQLSLHAQAFVQVVVTNLFGMSLFQIMDNDRLTIPSGPVLIVIRRLTLPYLRRCALLHKLLFDVSHDVFLGEEIKDEKLKTYDAMTAKKTVDWISSESRQVISDAFDDLKELEDLEQKFCLPSLQTILEEESNREVVLRWCQHLSKELGSRKFLPISRPVMATPFKLMELPTLYHTLLQRYFKQQCPVCSTVPEQPALCLLCGTLCCATCSRACCSTNRQSECHMHAMACGGGIGVFLMIRKTNILLQRCARQSSWPSPYLDCFGEEDIDMIRGKPLYLNEERYATLTELVVSHGLDHSSQVLSLTTRETVMWG